MENAIKMILNYIYTFPSSLVMLFTIKRFLPISKVWQNILLFFILTFAIDPVIWLGDMANILLVAALIFTFIPLLCSGHLLSRFSISILLFNVIISTSAIFSSLRPPYDKYVQFFSFILNLSIYLFVHHFVKQQDVQVIRSKRWLLLDALSILPFGITFVVVVFSEPTRTFVTNNERTDTLVIGNEKVLLIMLAMSALYSVGLLLYVALLARQEKLEQQEILWKIRQQHYVILEQNQIQVRRMRHDMANHLNAMAGMDCDSMRGYLFQLTSAPAITGGSRFCENDIVNAVLSGKISAIEKENIEADIQVTLSKELNISDIDLCAIFSNCIDNAIESCRKCQQDKRMIRLIARADKSIFALHLENSLAGELIIKGSKILTSKQDKKSHGFGMAEIQDIVQQHNGVLTFGQNCGSFYMQISMPITSSLN